LILEDEFSALEPLSQRVEIDFDVVGNRVAGRQVLGFNLGATSGTVEFDDPHPQWIGRETEITLDDREMHLSWVSIVQQATSLVVLSRRAQNAVAAIAKPLLPIQIEIEILSNPNAPIASCVHESCVSNSPIHQVPVFTSRV